MKLRFTYKAQDDLVRLREFIALKNPQAARNISLHLKEAISNITDHPQMGVDVKGLEQVQDLVRSDYIIRYTLRTDTVVILRIWHSREYR